MSLRDELKPAEEPVFSRINHQAHIEIDEQISYFLACGGSIKEILPGETANKDCLPMMTNEFTGQQSAKEYSTRIKSQKNATKSRQSGIGTMPVAFDGKTRVLHKSKWGENVRRMQKKDGTVYFTFRIGQEYFGSGQNWTHEQCIRERNIVYVRRGKPIPNESYE